MAAPTSNSASIRVALEGCGHGCLHDIYASVEKSAELKGWDGVDLLVIGGDFQAVRNSNDMACMSVPQKYKELGDFHEYYSGKRTAPYLTIFIGGNHEAGNHLFELHYGGWVAPNIYYMGAANVIRCGPLRISGMSGIWKGYDYRKPHFERLPYNRDDIQSIYHVRELDVRKLLQIRTQVDLGLSHDWPKQIELSGDYETLFRTKKGFRQDSLEGKLGNQAAKYVLDRLRPAYWFSAHLHVRFVASVQHGDYVIPGNPVKRQANSPLQTSLQAPTVSYPFGLDGSMSSLLTFDEGVDPRSRRAQQDIGNVPAEPSTEQNQEASVEETPSKPQPEPIVVPEEAAEPTGPQEAAGTQDHAGDEQTRISAWNDFHTVAAKSEAAENVRYLQGQDHSQGLPSPDVEHNLTWRKINVDENGTGRTLASIEQNGNTRIPGSKKQKVEHESVKNADEIDLDLDSDSEKETPSNAGARVETEAAPKPSKVDAADQLDKKVSSSQSQAPQANDTDVSQELRSQLPASFARPQPEPQPAQVNDPLPDAISNKTTHFLALDKCVPQRDFLQLVEFQTISDLEGAQCERPYRLQYDKEWLAITRVFDDHLILGDPQVKIPSDKGDAFYKSQIIEAEKWIEEHVVKPGKMTIPENFEPTAPVYDPSIPITTEQMPLEYTNPQTSQFCELIGIENKFHMSDEERQARMAAPRPSEPRGRFPRRGGGFGHGRGRGGRGRGGRGGRY
ncbi:DBR1-domain-containing protein [Aspergillus steynii IBT 23096]|uniref:DBR1-domain-containing protein n=1 Tax=Aspergillus steynii IBT 23096 TaxID=1392250 RepID=A0A2I2G3T1_9EURO|nr:DBR1-domain-containing protein [Aspergillus steynii IBT 23096]PLB47542.1 DBR1-domain-containing protein [Aspergillus steynii IBT 23096]